MTTGAPRAYVDQPIVDLGSGSRAADAAAIHWSLEQPVLVRHGMNAIYGTGNYVMRVSTPNADASTSLDLAWMLLDMGLRVTRPARRDVVEIGEVSVTCWERIEPARGDIDWREVGSMIRRVHEIDVVDLPENYPCPSPRSFPWWDFDALLSATSSVLDGQAEAGLRAAVDRNSTWLDFDKVVVCHGDVHPGNVMMAAEGPVLIDWDLLCAAPHGWDHAPMMTWADRWGGTADAYADFAAGYGCNLSDDPSASALAELRLVAATLMRVAAGLADESAMPEAQRRLMYWRGDPGAPQWRAN